MFGSIISGAGARRGAGPRAWILRAATPGWILALALALLAIHASVYRGFFMDDGFISLRYAHRLLDGKGLTWTDGEHVEGYSNLLWILGCAALGRLGLDLVTAARVLGALGMSAALGAVGFAHARSARERPLPLAFAAFAFSLSVPIGVWTLGGLEQGGIAGVLAWATVTTFPLVEAEGPEGAGAALVPGLLYGLLAVSRPDGILFGAVAAAVVVLLRGRRAAAPAFTLMVLTIAFFTAQLLFRFAYYNGEWVPNTAYVKLGFSAFRITLGAKYVLGGLAELPVLTVAAAFSLRGVVRAPRRDGHATLLLAIASVWMAYVVFVGGDIFIAHRHMVPVVVLFSLLTCRLLEGLGSAPGVADRLLRLAPLALGAQLTVLAFDPHVRAGTTWRWEWKGAPLGRLYHTAFGGRDALLAVDAAGALPFYAELPALDMLGLNDRHIARSPVSSRRTCTSEADCRGAEYCSPISGRCEYQFAHERGDGRYVLDRRPDLVVFGPLPGSPGAAFRSGLEMVTDPRFERSYRLVHVRAEDGTTGCAWAFLDGRIGVTRAPDEITIPAYFFASTEAAPATLDEGGRLSLPLPSASAIGVLRLSIPSGTWRLVTDPPEGVEVTLTPTSRWSKRRALGSGDVWTQTAREATDVVVGVRAAGARGATLRALALQRFAAAPGD